MRLLAEMAGSDDWRTPKDSNLRPTDSKSVALSS